NYPPGFAYILWIINKIYAFFKDPYNISEYWLDTNAFYLFLIKTLTIAADLLVVWLIIKIAQRLQRANLGKILALAYFLNPAVIYDGVIWGQVDQFGLALFLLSVYFLVTFRPHAGSIVFTLSCLMKFQNIIFIPLFYLFIFKFYSFKQVITSVRTSLIAFLIIVSPFLLAKQMDRLLYLLTVNSDWFPWYSLNAFNIWWIASGLRGMELVDKHLIVGITNAKQFGLVLYIFAYFIACITLFFSKKEEVVKNFILACSLAVFGFFHLLTQSHERYLYPLMGLLPILFIYSSRDRPIKLFFIFYVLFSLFFFLNMYLSMIWNYPDQGYMPFSKETTQSFSLIISLAQIGLFFIFTFIYFRSAVVKYRFVLISFAGLLIAALVVKNVNYLLKRPILLASLKPISYHQDYLVPVRNKTVESERGVKFWNRLSVNYYFYEKGIGSHADSSITYDLNKQFSRFSSDYGLDTESAETAQVFFLIEADGKEIFRSKPVGRFDPPGSTELNIKGVEYLTLKIKKAGESNFGAHADWLNPILVR
ncbi:NPCBM/NEW2 domain-containing protein, partial [Candidatus Roizmanbacteria bacterium]|nr:NPCBM/NEW2 domain-containing protein [Candidatus Roizmanbacteria bacterium]